MGSLEIVPATPISADSILSPRISFSVEFLDDENFISITPNSHGEVQDKKMEFGDHQKVRNPDFEFLSSNASSHAMLSADELFFDGKLLPFWQKQHAEQLAKLNLKTKDVEGDENEEVVNKEESRGSWFVDDDPSPRPPKCTVLWKELLRLKKQRASSLSPSSSSSSSSSSSNLSADVATRTDQEKEGNKKKYMKRIKKGLETTRSASIRIRPMVNVPICTQVKSSAFPPLFPLRKGRVLER
ncbi:hypothetical protein D8674_009864 [Pyrus ussuriensis x Pyrus communis]|uniref:Uncharacterized protein n=1 Tax=Pyrus ussuriensis x Pyrus communis TaxID=2448454 RepID=A0A5N5F9Y5_9ROSA|nr:hypothetical protein D8674_009864 [Pyrus ussuriensis x Pyrus communis]